MFNFKNWRIKTKLQILIIVPLGLLTLFMCQALWHKYSVINELDTAKAMIKLSISAGHFVHELQKERGSSAVFIGSAGSRFESELSQQRLLTDKARAEYLDVYRAFKAQYPDSNLIGLTDRIAQKNQSLDGIRDEVSKLAISKANAVGFYTRLNTQLIGIAVNLTNMLSNAKMARLAAAYAYLMKGKEKAGIERAVLSGVFATDSSTPKIKAKYIKLASQQESYINLAIEQQSINNGDNEAGLSSTPIQELIQGTSVDAVQNMRKIATNKNSGFGIEPEAWFKEATGRINLLKQAEDNLADSVYAFVSTSDDQAYHEFYSLLALIITAFSITSLLGFSILRHISGQLGRLSDAMLELGDNSNLSVQVEVMSSDDLGQLSQAFNKMVLAMKSLVADIHAVGGNLKDAVSTLNAISDDVQTQAEVGQDQSSEAAQAMQQMASSIEEMASNCAKAAQESGNTNNAAEQGKELLQTGQGDMDSLSQELESTRKMIAQVECDSDEIGSVLDVIKGVAEQTNLLALNAAIEAARAGEQGRGFAVVADEVRTLAQKTQESAVRIEEMIVRLQSGSCSAVEAMTKSQLKAQSTHATISDLVEQISNMIQQIGHVNDMNTQNAAATEQQSATVNAINGNIQDISSQYIKSRDRIAQLNHAADQVSDLHVRLDQGVQRFILE